MESAETSVCTQDEITGRLPWHKPQLQHLLVSIDTEIAKPGSGADGADAFDRLIGSPVD